MGDSHILLNPRTAPVFEIVYLYFLERATKSRGGAVDPKLVLPLSTVRHGHPPPTLTLHPGKRKRAESIKCFIEYRAFLRSS
jgi:hypothetical protein